MKTGGNYEHGKPLAEQEEYNVLISLREMERVACVGLQSEVVFLNRKRAANHSSCSARGVHWSASDHHFVRRVTRLSCREPCPA